MIYLEQFLFPDEYTQEAWLTPTPPEHNYEVEGYYSDIYPFRINLELGLHSLDFEPITILSGGNGSGKSTILNVIARKLCADRKTPYNTTNVFEKYADLCQYTSTGSLAGEEMFAGHRDVQKYDISTITHVITSDDIFNWMLELRLQNDRMLHKSKFIRDEYVAVQHEPLPRYLNLETGYNVNKFNTAVQMRRRSVTFNKYMSQKFGKLERTYSNGETALMRLSETLEQPGLYILDEPENSMSCEFQLKLADMISYFSRCGKCQFIIATHSPFLLALENAKVYNFDMYPVTITNWWETSNVQYYHDFFKMHSGKFKTQ